MFLNQTRDWNFFQSKHLNVPKPSAYNNKQENTKSENKSERQINKPKSHMNFYEYVESDQNLTVQSIIKGKKFEFSNNYTGNSGRQIEIETNKKSFLA